MKTTLLAILTFIVSTTNAQIKEVQTIKYEKIGRVPANNLAFITSIEFAKDTTTQGTNTYLWSYKNLKYKQLTDIQSISFTASEQEFNSLYDILKNQISAEKGTEKTMMLGKKSINIVTEKMMGITSLTIYDISSGGYFYLTSKQIDQLFGKN
jgi:hypothetical protein